MSCSLPDWISEAVAERFGCLGGAPLSRAVVETGLSPASLALALLPEAASRAHAPVSGLRVGAVAHFTLQDGAEALALGANFECAGAALGSAVHAEQAAVHLARAHGARRLQSLVLSAPPCGHCRQFLLEIAGADDLRVAWGPGEEARLRELIPHSFGPVALGAEAALLSAVPHQLLLRDDSSDSLVLDAFEAARAAYAPYSKTYAGAALLDAQGAVFTGCSLESVAFNPSLGAMQAALSAMALARAPSAAFPPPVRAVLVEVAGRVSQRVQAEAMLAALAPSLALEFHAAEFARR